jgi:putative phage-type endonuclease
MIILDVEQGSEEWLAARAGIPTASCFDKIITSTGKASTSADAYMNKLLGEWLMGGPEESFSSDWMQRGNELEPEARAFYEFETETPVEQVGIVYLDDQKLVSCSPDGLTQNGGIEIKCPSAGVHTSYLLSGSLPTKYKQQVQGCMWICQRSHWDFIAYHPGIDPLICRVIRDDNYIADMCVALNKFTTKMLERREQLQQYRRVI